MDCTCWWIQVVQCLVRQLLSPAGGFGLLWGEFSRPGRREAMVRLERNTLVTSTWLVHLSWVKLVHAKLCGLAPDGQTGPHQGRRQHLGRQTALTFLNAGLAPQERGAASRAEEAETAFRTMIQWDDGRNLSRSRSLLN